MGIDINPFDNIGASAAKGFLEAADKFLTKYPLLQDALRGERLELDASVKVGFQLRKAEAK